MSSGRRTLLLFALFQALYALTSSGNVFRVPDEFEVYFQTEHLVDAGSLAIPQTLAITQPVVRNGRVVGSQSMFFGEIGRNGRPYAPYGPLVAVLAVPHHVLGRLVASTAAIPRPQLPGGIAWLIAVGGITMLATATAGALTVAGFHRAVLAMSGPPAVALGLSLVLGGATVLWPYSTSFFSEAWQAAAFVWAAALLLEARASARAAAVAGACVLVLAAGLTKATSLVFAPAFVVAALVDRRSRAAARDRSALALGAAIITAVGIHLIWNAYRFGRPFDFGYDWSETIPQLPAHAFLASDIPRGLAVLLLSPGKSILVWAPSIVIAALGFPRLWRTDKAMAGGILVASITGLLMYAAYLFPEGGYCHGPRHLVPILPLLLLPAVCGVDRPSAPVRSLAVACVTAGFFVSVTATAVSYLEDESLGGDLTAGARTVYYERIVPAPGRPWNRYRLDYVPFVTTLAEPGWFSNPILGQGPDYFPLHLMQARRQLPDGQTIPLWLVWGWPAVWASALATSAMSLARTTRRQA